MEGRDGRMCTCTHVHVRTCAECDVYTIVEEPAYIEHTGAKHRVGHGAMGYTCL